MYQKVTIVGHLGADPEMRFLPDGKPVASFRMATSRKWAQGEETIWWRVSCWGTLAETVNEHLRKGRLVLVEGQMHADPKTGGPRVWQDKDGTPRASYELTASIVKFLGGAKQDGDAGQAPELPF